jgi:hypothetical protein
MRGLRQRPDDGRRGCAVDAARTGFATEGQWRWAPVANTQQDCPLQLDHRQHREREHDGVVGPSEPPQ